MAYMRTKEIGNKPDLKELYGHSGRDILILIPSPPKYLESPEAPHSGCLILEIPFGGTGDSGRSDCDAG
jgi:hypothetical protein